MSILTKYIRPYCNQGDDGFAAFIALMHLKRTLLAVKAGELVPKKRHGICMLTGHIPKDYAPYVDSWIGINLIRRPEYSGAPVFPIPAPNGGCPSDAFYDHPDLWDISTEYGRSRWEAIDYLLSLLEVMDVTDAQSDENALFCET